MPMNPNSLGYALLKEPEWGELVKPLTGPAARVATRIARRPPRQVTASVVQARDRLR